MDHAGYYETKVGSLAVTALHDGLVRTQRGEGFIAGVPEEEVEAAYAEAGFPPGGMVISFTSYAVQIGDRLTLIDPGFGQNGPASAGRVRRNLASAGLDASQVDRILISHFHGDHIAGLITKDGEPSYPDAEILVPTLEWDFWMGDAMAEAEVRKPNFALCRRVFGALGDRVRRFAWGDAVAPGVTALPAPGHSPGMTAFDITSDGERLVFVADVSNTPTVFARHPDWAARFDMDAAQARETRHRIFAELAASGTRVAFFHAPFPGLGTIARQGEAYTWLPQVWGIETV